MESSFWDITDPVAFTNAFLEDLVSRRSAQRLSPLRSTLLDVLDLDARMATDGFADIFYQMLTAQQCRSVELMLAELGLHSLAGLFGEAFLIYCRGNPSISDEEFALLDPFSLDTDAGARFDEISDLFVAEGSEIYRMCEAVRPFAVKRRADLDA